MLRMHVGRCTWCVVCIVPYARTVRSWTKERRVLVAVRGQQGRHWHNFLLVQEFGRYGRYSRPSWLQGVQAQCRDGQGRMDVEDGGWRKGGLALCLVPTDCSPKGRHQPASQPASQSGQSLPAILAAQRARTNGRQMRLLMGSPCLCLLFGGLTPMRNPTPPLPHWAFLIPAYPLPYHRIKHADLLDYYPVRHADCYERARFSNFSSQLQSVTSRDRRECTVDYCIIVTILHRSDHFEHTQASSSGHLHNSWHFAELPMSMLPA